MVSNWKKITVLSSTTLKHFQCAIAKNNHRLMDMIHAPHDIKYSLTLNLIGGKFLAVW